MNNDVQFKEEWRPQVAVPRKGWGEKLADFLVKYSGGLIKDENQAAYVILGFVVVAIIVSLFLIFGGGPKSENLEKSFPPGSSVFVK
jgi:hypothetical protein